MTLEKINPALYITDLDPLWHSSMSVGSWYQDETTIITDPEKLNWLLLQGWNVSSNNSTTDNNGVKQYEYKLSRRSLKPERALDKLMSAQTSAFNEGRRLNDQRYDDLVTLYSVMLDKTEDELNSINADDSIYDDLVNSILDDLDSDFDEYKLTIDTLMEGYGESELTQINTQFDARLSDTKQSLIDRGMNNSTLLDSMTAGIERERAIAITDLNDKLNDRQLTIEERKFKARIDVRLAILAARDRLRIMLSKGEEQHVVIRNRLMEIMLAFIERREDSYPSVDGMVQAAANLGAGSVNHPGV